MEGLHPAARDPLPIVVTSPGETDVLFNITIIVFLIAIFLIGILYLRLHALPEQIAHKTSKIQFQLVAVLGLIALFTHNHLYWIAGLLLAFVEFPDFTSSMGSIAQSLDKIASRAPQRSRSNSAQSERMEAPLSDPTIEVANEPLEQKE